MGRFSTFYDNQTPQQARGGGILHELLGRLKLPDVISCINLNKKSTFALKISFMRLLSVLLFLIVHATRTGPAGTHATQKGIRYDETQGATGPGD